MIAPPNFRISIIGGGGMVGAASGYAIMMKNVPAEIVLVDIMETVAEGHAIDIADAGTRSPAMCRVGTYADAGDSNIIVITAGLPQKPGQSRAELLQANYGVMKDICNKIRATLREDTLILVVANPVDVLAAIVQKELGIEHRRVFGSGTHLDSCRLRSELAGIINVNSDHILAYVLGEHGDDQFVAWDSATIKGISRLLDHPLMKDKNLEEIRENVMKKAYRIIDAKRSTYFGIGGCVAEICQSIVNNEHQVYPLSNFHTQLGSYISYPCTVGRKGVEQVFRAMLTPEEEEKLAKATNKIKEAVKTATGSS